MLKKILNYLWSSDKLITKNISSGEYFYTSDFVELDLREEILIKTHFQDSVDGKVKISYFLIKTDAFITPNDTLIITLSNDVLVKLNPVRNIDKVSKFVISDKVAELLSEYKIKGISVKRFIKTKYLLTYNKYFIDINKELLEINGEVQKST